ncbi:uncharacterized protein LOC124497088 [Dermatophagoides farinae]|uniref:uncharacterized protein LOC124497088 n=1 Tax=Dermatophagoides farinae TaxID=6954 RepID=UPI003F621DF3
MKRRRRQQRPPPIDTQPIYRFNWTALQWHFMLSFSLIFITPLIDVIIFMPTYMDIPRKEFHFSIWTAIIVALLTILANNDIHEQKELMEIRILPIGLFARFLFGFSIADLSLLSIQWLYIYCSWPYLYKNIRFIGYRLISGTGMFRIIDMLDEQAEQKFYVDKIIDYDGCALFLMQTIRLTIITAKVLLAHSIRWQISRRNIHIYRMMMKKSKQQRGRRRQRQLYERRRQQQQIWKDMQISLSFATLIIHQGEFFIRRIFGLL